MGLHGQDEVLDFFEQSLKYTDTVKLPASDQHDPDVCAARLRFVEEAFERHSELIRSTYRAADPA